MPKTSKKSPKVEKPENLGIASLKLQNIGPFDEQGLTINFGKKLNDQKANVHIFVGENGCGKSSVLKTLFFGSYKDKSVFLETLFFQSYEDRKSLITVNNGNFFEGLDPKDKQWDIFKDWKNVFYYTPNEPAIKQEKGELFYTPKNKDSRNNLISNWICEYVEQNYLDKIKELENNRNALLANDKKEEGKLGKDEIKEIEILIKMTVHIEEFIKKIYADTDFKYKWKNTTELYRPWINGKFFEFNQLSLGYRQIISLITDILIKVWSVDSNLEKKEELEFTLLLDEIDIHLHPKAQRRILPALQSLFPNAEIFCTTHSPFVVNSVSDAWVYELKMENGKFIDDQTGEVLDEIGDKNPANKENYKNRRVSSDGDSYIFSVLEDFNISQLFGKEAQENLKKLSDNLRKKQDISKEIEILKSYKGKEIEDAILVLLKQFNKENLWQD
jgi:predicted ATP-binding protein involved in virulence